MRQSEFTARFLDNDYKEIWQLIQDNELESLMRILKPDKKGWFNKGFTEKIEQIVYELFKNGNSKTLANEKFSINEGSDLLYINLVRLLYAMAINGNLTGMEEQIAAKLYNSARGIASEIREKAGDYPHSSINAGDWMRASGMRNGFYGLSYYYEQKNDLESQLWIETMRTIITLGIMGHYKHMVGPDMLTVASLEEKLGKGETALTRYKAVVADFEDEVSWYRDNPEEKPANDDPAILESLLIAYKSIDRLENGNRYEANIEEIQKILER